MVFMGRWGKGGKANLATTRIFEILGHSVYLFWAKYSVISATESFLKEPAALIPISMFSAVISLCRHYSQKKMGEKGRQLTRQTPL